MVVGVQPDSGAFNSPAVRLFVHLTDTLMSASAFFTKSAPFFAELLWGKIQYSRYRQGSAMRNELRFIADPTADDYTRRRDARTITVDYEHIAGLAKALRKENVAVEQLPRVKGGKTHVSATTGLTWSDVEWQGYKIPAELVSQLVDEANAALSERAANLSQGHAPNTDDTVTA